MYYLRRAWVFAFFIGLEMTAPAGAQAPSISDNRNACVAGAPGPPFRSLRPMPMAICDYEPAEFFARIARLLEMPEGALGIEAVETIFGLPMVTTPYDNPRSAAYSATLRSAQDRDEWSAIVSVRETYGPDIESRPIRFRGSLRPVRINPGERGEIDINIVMLGSLDQLSIGRPFCLTPQMLARMAQDRDWRRSQELQIPSPHAPPNWTNMRLLRGGLSLSSSYTDFENECVRNLYLSQPGNPPIVRITEAETVALRIRSAHRLAEATEERMLAQPAQGVDDLNARRARARLHRDHTLEHELNPAGSGWNRLVEAMSEAQLRQFVFRFLNGHYWRTNGYEACEAAVLSEDPHAELARRTDSLGWNEIEALTLETLCELFIDGRRYRSRSVAAEEASSPRQP